MGFCTSTVKLFSSTDDSRRLNGEVLSLTVDSLGFIVEAQRVSALPPIPHNYRLLGEKTGGRAQPLGVRRQLGEEASPAVCPTSKFAASLGMDGLG